jgi:hypothetical protein
LCFKLKVIQTLIGPPALAAFIGDNIPKKGHKKNRSLTSGPVGLSICWHLNSLFLLNKFTLAGRVGQYLK